MTEAEALAYVAQLDGDEKALWDESLRLFRLLSLSEKIRFLDRLKIMCQKDAEMEVKDG